MIHQKLLFVKSFTEPCCCFRIRGRLTHSGVFFSLLSMVCAISGLYFYLDRSANRNLSPAESQNLNVECTVLNFFDSVSIIFHLKIFQFCYRNLIHNLSSITYISICHWYMIKGNNTYNFITLFPFSTTFGTSSLLLECFCDFLLFLFWMTIQLTQKEVKFRSFEFSYAQLIRLFNIL